MTELSHLSSLVYTMCGGGGRKALENPCFSYQFTIQALFPRIGGAFTARDHLLPEKSKAGKPTHLLPGTSQAPFPFLALEMGGQHQALLGVRGQYPW